jgi:hypothetical protein
MSDEPFEVTELDDQDLEDVSGGATSAASNGNCSCPAGTTPPGGFDNGNCSCSGGVELQ